ncbi:hypothetical protein GCM10022287_17670 [Gryllotalpicola koreensis]|uniref:Uncharacterized protein n=2 Tax=Gryllotalpicola koreensis TaxID=993086 RepID=A0ABP7ZZP7_9MICO
MWAATQFQLFGPEAGNLLNNIRGIGLVQDGACWHFTLSGEQQPFEDPAAYGSRRVRERFTTEMLDEYCRALGLRVFDESFYSGEAYLVEHSPAKFPPDAGRLVFDLDEARTWLGISEQA